MNKRRLNEIAVALEKVNYLYRNMRKSSEPVKRLELALLKKYVLDLYDNILVMEMPDLEMEQHEVVTDPPKFAYTPSIVLPPPPVQEPPIAENTVAENTTDDHTPLPLEAHDEAETYIADHDEATINPPPPTNTEPIHKSTALHEWSNDHHDDDDTAKTQVLDDLLRRDSRPSTNIEQPLKLVADFDEDDEGETIAIGDMNSLLNKAATDTAPPRRDTGSRGGTPFNVTFNQRIAFVRELFENDENAYSTAMNELSESRGYIEALTYINLNLRYDFHWKDNDPVVKEFLEMVKHRYLG